MSGFGRTEARLVVCLVRWISAAARDESGEHPYGQEVRPLLGVLLGCALLEGVIVEVLLAVLLPGTPWPWILLALHGYGLLWIAGLHASLRSRPHRLEPHRLLLRDSVFAEVSVPLEALTGVRMVRRSGQFRSGFTVEKRSAVLGYGDTTLLLLLDPDIPLRVEGAAPLTGLSELYISVDDPRRLRRALHERIHPASVT